MVASYPSCKIGEEGGARTSGTEAVAAMIKTFRGMRKGMNMGTPSSHLVGGEVVNMRHMGRRRLLAFMQLAPLAPLATTGTAGSLQGYATRLFNCELIAICGQKRSGRFLLSTRSTGILARTETSSPILTTWLASTAASRLLPLQPPPIILPRRLNLLFPVAVAAMQLIRALFRNSSLEP